MITMNFVQIEKGNDEQFKQLLTLWIPYMKEVDQDNDDSNYLTHAKGIVSIQGTREDMHLELCYKEDQLIGFCFYAVDLGGIKDLIDPNYGYIMELYVKPGFRRLGFGKAMFSHIEHTFSSHGTEYMYLTPDEVSGEPFWKSLGFKDSGKKDPDNHMPLFIKRVKK